MKRMSELLSEELLRWPDVSARPMFGMRAFYHGAVIFAMLPDKRALESPTAIAYKRPIGAKGHVEQKWRRFELKGARDLGEALACLDKAYRTAGRTAGRAQNRL
jgi:hypothetical protein